MTEISRTTRIVTCVLGFMGAGIIGWTTGGRSKKEEPVPVEAARPVAEERRPGSRNAASREIALRMKAIRDAGTQEERIRNSVSLAMSLPASEFAAWAKGDRFDFRAGPELNVFRMVLFERWALEDPESLIGFCMESDWGQAARGVAQLMKDDPQRVLEYFRQHPNDKFELGKLVALAGSDSALVLARLQEMSERGVSSELGGMAGGLFRELSKTSPAMLEAALENLAPVLREQAEIALSGQRLSENFEDEFRSLWDQPDGWKIFSNNLSRNGALAAKLLGEIAGMPVAWKNALAESPYYAVGNGTARQWLELDLEGMGFSKSGAENIRKRAAAKAMESNPGEVMGKLDSLGFQQTEKAEMFKEAFSKLKKSPEEAERLIRMLTNEEDRVSAREQLALVQAAGKTEKNLPPSDWLKSLGSPGQSRSAAYRFAHATTTWSEAQVSEFRTAFDSMEQTEKKNVAMILSSGGQGDDGITGDAIRYLVRNPPEPKTDDVRFSRNGPQVAAAQYAMRLASKDLNSATEWIKTLPAGDARTWSLRNVAADLQQYDPPAVRQWVKSLPAGEREDVSGFLNEKK